MTTNHDLSPAAELCLAMWRGTVIDTTTGAPFDPNLLTGAVVGKAPHMPIGNPRPGDNTDLVRRVRRVCRGDLPVPEDVFTASWSEGNRTTVLLVFPGEAGAAFCFTSFHYDGGVWTTDLTGATVENDRLGFELRPHDGIDDLDQVAPSVAKRVAYEAGVLLNHLVKQAAETGGTAAVQREFDFGLTAA